MYLFMVGLYTAALFLTVISFIFVAFQKTTENQKMLLQTLFAWGITAIGYYFKINARGSEGLYTAQKLIFFGTGFCFYLLFVFFMSYCDMKLSRKISAVLATVCFAISVLAFTFDKHTLFYASFKPVSVDGIPAIEHEAGIGYVLYVIQIALYILAMIVIAIRQRVINGRNGTRKTVSLLLVLLGPSLGYAGTFVIKGRYEFQPLGFLFSVLVILYLVYVDKIYDVSDLAKQYAFTYMDCAYIVIDGNNCYRGCSPKAELLFPELRNMNRSTDIGKLSMKIDGILKSEISEYEYEKSTYKVSVIEIEENDKILGKLIWFDDITSYREHLDLVKKYQAELEEQVKVKTAEAEERRKKVEQTAFQMVRTLANTIDAKDRYTNGHSTRVAEYAVLLAKELGWNEEKLENLRYQGLLHDIGKIGVPDSILNKPSRLSEREYEIIKQHTILGARVLSDTTSIPGAWKVAEYHHERYDGKGYPEGLKGEDIPLSARIVGIADAYDAMSTTRVYRRSLSRDQIRNELVNGRGTQFDPVLTDHFLRLLDAGKLEDVGRVDRGSELYGSMWGKIPDKSDLSLSALMELVQRDENARGALEVDYEEFADLYEYFGSIKKRYEHHFTFCLMTIAVLRGDTPAGDIEAAQAVLRDIIGKTIRGVDVCSRINSRQLLVVLLDAGENASAIMERLENRFMENYPDQEFEIKHEISEI